MMRTQTIVSAIDKTGSFTTMSHTSRGAAAAGMNHPAVVGRKMWEFATAATQRAAYDAFCNCLFTGTRQTFNNATTIGGTIERWETTLIPAAGSEIVAFTREIHTPPPYKLTAIDFSLLAQLADDITIEEIALSENAPASTISARLKRLREKLGIKTNHGLAVWALRNGVVSE